MPSKPPAPSDIADKFMLRLPDGMRDRIAEAAKASNRSMNAEIVVRLDASFREGVVSQPLAEGDENYEAAAEKLLKQLQQLSYWILNGLSEAKRGGRIEPPSDGAGDER